MAVIKKLTLYQANGEIAFEFRMEPTDSYKWKTAAGLPLTISGFDLEHIEENDEN